MGSFKIFLILLFLSSWASANVVGVSTQNFNPTSNGIDFVTVQSSETLKPGIFNLGLFLNYAVNTLPNYQNTNNQSLTSPKDQLTSMDLSVGLGLMDGWDLGFTIPRVLTQSVDSDSTTFQGLFENTGITEFRANTKVRLFKNQDFGLAFVGSVNIFLIENYPFTGIDPGPTINLELAADTKIGKFNIAGNIGYRLRNPGDPVTTVPVTPFPDEFIASGAVSYLFPSIDTKVIAEVYASFPTEDVQFTTDRNIATAEFLAGLKWDATDAVALHFGAGSEIIHGSGSPDFRVYTGLNWNFGPVFGKPYRSEDLIAYDTTPVEPASPAPRIIYIDEVDFNQVPQKEETFVAKDVLFDFDSSRIKPAFLPILKKLAAYLEGNGGFRKLDIVGHTDSVGRASYNYNLSHQRANAVRKQLTYYLQSNNRGRVRAQGRGETQPIADNGNYQGRALNRRVEFRIYR